MPKGVIATWTSGHSAVGISGKLGFIYCVVLAFSGGSLGSFYMHSRLESMWQ
ncbi:unnamed protein product [Absidia cylindrospora]